MGCLRLWQDEQTRQPANPKLGMRRRSPGPASRLPSPLGRPRNMLPDTVRHNAGGRGFSGSTTQSANRALLVWPLASLQPQATLENPGGPARRRRAVFRASAMKNANHGLDETSYETGRDLFGKPVGQVGNLTGRFRDLVVRGNQFAKLVDGGDFLPGSVGNFTFTRICRS